MPIKTHHNNSISNEYHVKGNDMKGVSDGGLPDTPLVDLLLTQALVFSQMSKPDCLKTLNAKQLLFEIGQDGHLNV